eukprot:6287434-Pyramimonas_sp.AAC.1
MEGRRPTVAPASVSFRTSTSSSWRLSTCCVCGYTVGFSPFLLCLRAARVAIPWTAWFSTMGYTFSVDYE